MCKRRIALIIYLLHVFTCQNAKYARNTYNHHEARKPPVSKKIGLKLPTRNARKRDEEYLQKFGCTEGFLGVLFVSNKQHKDYTL